jgi:hypothetical protein
MDAGAKSGLGLAEREHRDVKGVSPQERNGRVWADFPTRPLLHCAVKTRSATRWQHPWMLPDR